MKLLLFVSYLSCSGLLVFLCGRFYPRKWIFENNFPFNSFFFEKEGEIYNRIKIKAWKNRWPDASKIFHKIFGRFYPKKQIERANVNKIPVLIKESCIAEATHFFAIILGLLGANILKGIGVYAIWILWTIWNIPPILIQRYNRPRLKRALKRAIK